MNGPSCYAKRYGVYDSDGNQIGYKEVEDANNYINPAEIKKAIEAVIEQANLEYKNYLSKEFAIALQKGIVVIDGVDAAVSKQADQSYETLRQIPGYMEKNLYDDYRYLEQAVEVRNYLQQKLNESTYDMLLQNAHEQGYENVTIREV